MKTIKFLVKVNRGGVRIPEYVRRIDRTPIEMTIDRRQALLMGRFTAEDAVKSIQTSRRRAELVYVTAHAGLVENEPNAAAGVAAAFAPTAVKNQL
jgi:hypothetical protein